MTDNKYYTPSIEDIYVGYECEMKTPDGWKQFAYLHYNDLDFSIIEEDLDMGNLRTPYLTKEQIEAEGWRLYSSGIDLWFEKKVLTEEFDWSRLCNLYGYKPYKLFLNYGLHDHKIHIKCDFTGGQDFSESDTLFEGLCLSMNEFRKLCKWIGI